MTSPSFTGDLLAPSDWPAPPEWMSYSTLKKIESCPRQWSLSSATYSYIWSKDGYPSVPSPNTLEGIVLHRSFQRILNSLAASGTTNIYDENTVKTIKSMGGFSEVLKLNIESVIQTYAENPRAIPFLPNLKNRLIGKIATLRPKLQYMLSRITLVPTTITTNCYTKKIRKSPLPNGTFPELSISAAAIRWCGIADLVIKAGTTCEIWEVKSGEAQDWHKQQLQVYSLLWARDTTLNPLGTQVSRLVLCYGSSEIDVPVLDESNLNMLEEDLKNKTQNALSLLQQGNSEAKISENCRYCNVRQLCNTYWTSLDTAITTTDVCGFGDMQISVVEASGPKSWKGYTLFKGGKTVQPTILRTTTRNFNIRAGQQLRVLNANITTIESDFDQKVPILCVTAVESTEIFFL